MSSHQREADIVSISSSLSSTPTEATPLITRLSDEKNQPTWSGEFSWLVKNAIPIVFTFLMQNSLQLASVFTLGHLGPTELAAAALASMFASVTAWSIAFGTATALDTLCSQSWTGCKDKTQVGVHLQRGLVILAVMFVPIAIVWWNSENILLSLNQEPQLAYQAGLFMKCLMVGAPAFIAFEATKKFLQAQGIMQASTYVLMIVSPLNLVLNYSFVYLPPFNLGFKGAPLATSLSYWLMFILLVCYIRFVKGREAWGGWTTECLHGWWPFLKLSIPSLLMITAEWWAFELSSLAASYLSTRDLAAQSILLTSGSATYTIPFGISVAASNRIGNALGEGNGRKAHLATRVALIFAVVFGCTNSFFFMAARERFGYLFTPDEDVAQLVSKIMPLCALFQITDGLAGVSGGAIRGMGRQSFAAWINLFSYYVVALPIGYFLAFKLDWDLSGLWFGLCIALFLVALASVIFLMCTNWDSEVKRAQARIHMEDDQDHHAAV